MNYSLHTQRANTSKKKHKKALRQSTLAKMTYYAPNAKMQFPRPLYDSKIFDHLKYG